MYEFAALCDALRTAGTVREHGCASPTPRIADTSGLLSAVAPPTLNEQELFAGAGEPGKPAPKRG